MNKKIKVLYINVDSDEFGGVPVFSLNIFWNIDHEKVQIDFLTPGSSSYHSLQKEIESYGGNIFEFHVDFGTLRGKRKFANRLGELLEEGSYNIVHINSGSLSLNCISSGIAKSKGVKVVAHSHNAGGRSRWKDLLSLPFKLYIQNKADVLCACSEAAARHLYTGWKVNRGDVQIIKNGIDLQRYRYNEEKRNRVREELDIEDRFVVGHIGRFAKQKNHKFLIDIFSEVLKKEPSAVLLLIGQGELEPIIRENVQNLHMEDHVIFLGARVDPEDFYQAMDVFLFPSLYEGLGLVLVEAQASGLPCVISDTIPTEIDLTELIHREFLKASPEQWAQKVIDSGDYGERYSRDQELSNTGYDIKKTALHITEIYENLV